MVCYDVVMVAGGAARRLGGVTKADITVGGVRLLNRTLAATTHARHRVLVGTGIAVPDDVVVTLEDPPGGGPAAGTAAGLRAIPDPSPWTVLLSGDLVDPGPGVAILVTAAGDLDDSQPDGAASDPASEIDSICLADDGGHPQWLFGIHRTNALALAVARLGAVHDRSMKALLADQHLRTLTVPAAVVAEIDTPEDYARWSSR